ncbi:MAG: D-alanyl-D-alanine carboxypeptidase/D-alanyl-D-alanine-endopeptidase [Candidatus Kapaibacterium sp.]
MPKNSALKISRWIVGAMLTIVPLTMSASAFTLPPGVAHPAVALETAIARPPQDTIATQLYAIHPHFLGYQGDTALGLNALRAQIDRLLAGTETRGMTTSVKVVFFEPNDQIHPIFARNAGVSVLPASVEKMFTSSSTLWALGSKYVFNTKLDLAPKARIEGTRIIGNVNLRPSGDPTLRSTDFDALAVQLRARGITQIQGDIVSDLSVEDELTPEARKYFATHADVSKPITTKDSSMDALASGDLSSGDSIADPADEQSGGDEEDVTDPGVLSSTPNFAIDRNVIRVTVVAGARKGAGVSVRVSPPISTIVVANHGASSAPAVRTKRRVRVGGKHGKHGRKAKTRIVYGSSRGKMTLHVSVSGGPEDPRQVVSVSGLIPARSSRTYSFPIRNVPLAMAALLKWRFQQNGIQITGVARTDRTAAPKTSSIMPIITVAEKRTSLMDLLMQMNKRSDNYLAESMFRKLATIATGSTTSPDLRSRSLMKSWLQVCSVDGTQCTVIDGSGLSRGNRTTANSVIKLLSSIKEQGGFDQFTQTLSIAGYDGTLRNRMKGTPAQYNAHGKTGTLNGVTALAGYVLTLDGQLAAYFITMQNFHRGPQAYRHIQDNVVAAISNFKYSSYMPTPVVPMAPAPTVVVPQNNVPQGSVPQGSVPQGSAPSKSSVPSSTPQPIPQKSMIPTPTTNPPLKPRLTH